MYRERPVADPRRLRAVASGTADAPAAATSKGGTSWNSSSLDRIARGSAARLLVGCGSVVCCSAPGSSARTSPGSSIKRFGRPLPAGPHHRAATARPATRRGMLPPGWHFGAVARGSTRSSSVPLVDRRARARSRSSSRRTAPPIPAERMLGARGRLRRLPGRGARSSTTAARRAGSSRILTAGTLPHQPGAVRRRHRTATRAAVRPVARAAARVPASRRSRRHRDGARRPADPAGRSGRARSCRVTTASSAARRSSTPAAAAACRRRCCSSGAWNLNPWFVAGRADPADRDPDRLRRRRRQLRRRRAPRRLGRRLHARRPRRARPQGRVGRAAAARQAPAQHAGDEGRARARPRTSSSTGRTRTEAHHYDEKLSLDHRAVARTASRFSLDVSQIIHIGMKNAPRVISRVGSMQNLVDHVLQPTVGNYFRNSAQEVTVLEFLSARSERQQRGVRRHPRGASRPTTSSASTR